MARKYCTALCVAILALAGCRPGSSAEGQRATTVIEDDLFGIEYDDYDFDAAVAYYAKHKPADPAPACSQVRLGDYLGRNLDYYINRNAAAVIKVNANGDRLASVGIVGCSREFTTELARSGEYGRIYEYLPLRTSDGINEKGVYMGVNIMPTGETSLDPKRWRSGEWGMGAAYTNPGAEHTYCTVYMTRFVLDRAKSVDDAIELIRSVNWYEPVDYPQKGHAQAFHWMLADSTRNCVIEFLDNELVVTEAEDLRKPSFGTIMTNFTNACRARDIWQDHGAGFERFDVLYKAYPEAEESFAGVEHLMQKVWYSKYYTTPVRSEDYWLSEAEVDGYEAWKLYGHPEYWDDPAIMDSILQSKKDWEDRSNWFVDDSDLWFTVHNSVYNLKDKRFEVIAHEGMSGMKGYRAFGLDASFSKPLDCRK